MFLDQKLSVGSVARYVFLPGIIPRLKDFAREGFGRLAYMMAVIYYAVRLLPQGHPYLNPANAGRFGMRHVIIEAGRHIEFKKENIDQIIIYLVLFIGFVLLVLQFAYLIFMFAIKPVFAAPFAGIFATVKPEKDIAFMLLDSVFGIPDLFNSCIAKKTACGSAMPVSKIFPTPFHEGLHALFQFYSTAMLLVGVLIFLYYVLIVVGETAQTGTPFGKRFNHIWAPLRLVVALGLLVPINHGLNSAQYITLYAAKLGSGMATNGWLEYNRGLKNAMGVNNKKMIAVPTAPEVGHVMQFMTLVHACAVAYQTIYSEDGPDRVKIDIKPYLVKTSGEHELAPQKWEKALEFYNNRDIVVRYGHYDPERYSKETGGVKPYCGEITIHTTDLRYPGTAIMQSAYYDWIMQMFSPDGIIDKEWEYYKFGVLAGCIHLSPKPSRPRSFAECSDFGWSGESKLPPDAWKQQRTDVENAAVKTIVGEAYDAMLSGTSAFPGRRPMSFAVEQQILDHGWGGAGIWYNNIAQWNGALFSSVNQVPTPSLMPSVMEKVEENNRAHNESMNPNDRYTPNLKGGQAISYDVAGEGVIASLLSDVYKYWREKQSVGTVEEKVDSNVFISVIRAIFGADGLYSMKQNSDVHPLAQLAALGKGVLDAAIRNLMVGLAFSALGGMTEILGPHVFGVGLSAISGMLISFTTIGLTIGFLLYYVLPFLPFIYFFFAVSAWVKTIFEAMVGVPLWALAHLRIDGNGLPGDAAMGGYFLIFEIFIRPILTVFGLLGAIVIFAAMARTLNEIFTLVTTNLTGFDCVGCSTDVNIIADWNVKRDVVDEFFFTVMYAILVYMIGLSSFKLIDRIPDGILRWIGAGVKSFGDQDVDPTQGLIQYAAYGGVQMTGQVVSASQQIAQVGGQTLGKGLHGLGGLFGRNSTARVSGAGPGPGPGGGGGGAPGGGGGGAPGGGGGGGPP